VIEAGEATKSEILDIFCNILAQVAEVPADNALRNEANALLGEWAREHGSFKILDDENTVSPATIKMLQWWQKRAIEKNSPYPLTLTSLDEYKRS
jgi:hypothetical protein